MDAIYSRNYIKIRVCIPSLIGVAALLHFFYLKKTDKKYGLKHALCAYAAAIFALTARMCASALGIDISSPDAITTYTAKDTNHILATRSLAADACNACHISFSFLHGILSL